MSRVAVVTGGASGIGLGAAQQLAAEGHAVALLDRNGPGAEAAAADLRAAGRACAGGRGRRRRPRIGRGRVRTRCGASSARSGSSSPARGSSRSSRCSRSRRSRGRGSSRSTSPARSCCVQVAVPDMIEAGLGPHRHDLVAERAVGRAQHGALQRVEGWRHRADQVAGGGPRPEGHHRQHHRAEHRRHADGPRRRGRRRLPRRRRRRADGPARSGGHARPTSPPRSRTCAPRTAGATSPASSSASTAACTSDGRRTRTYRVVQWTTGNVGTSSVQAIAANPAFELVGCYAWSAEKVGRDVGELCGIGAARRHRHRRRRRAARAGSRTASSTTRCGWTSASWSASSPPA